MMTVYINYPNPKITIHCDPDCSHIRAMQKVGQRNIRLSIDTLSDELRHFHSKEYAFGATVENNDMWLVIDFKNAEFERAVVGYVQFLVGQHYAPLARVDAKLHCE